MRRATLRPWSRRRCASAAPEWRSPPCGRSAMRSPPHSPTTTVKVLPSLGTGGGLAAVAAGAIDLAVAARALNDAERAKGLQCFAYAQTPMAFVTHPDVGVRGVTLAEVAAILAGRHARVAERDANPTDPAGTLGRRLDHAADLVARNGGGRAGRAGAARSAHAGDRPGECGRAGTAARLIRRDVDRPDCAPKPAASPRSRWMANRRRSRHWPADATNCRAPCMSPRASQPTEDVARFLAFLSSRADGRIADAARPHTARRHGHMSHRKLRTSTRDSRGSSPHLRR